MSDVFSKLTERSVRWLRKNFFDGNPVPTTKFSVCDLIDPSKKQSLLKPCFDTLSDNDKEMFTEKLWMIPEYKQKIILFLVQPQNSNNEIFSSKIGKNPQFELITTVDLSQSIELIIANIEQAGKLDVSVLFYISENAGLRLDEIKTAIIYAIGYVGKKNVTVICADKNAYIEDFAMSLGVDFDYSKQLGIE